MKKSINKPYEQDEYFKKWLVGLSPRTKENYSDDFYGWWKFVKMTPTEQIEKRLKDTRSDNMDDRIFFEQKFLQRKETKHQKRSLLGSQRQRSWLKWSTARRNFCC